MNLIENCKAFALSTSRFLWSIPVDVGQYYQEQMQSPDTAFKQVVEISTVMSCAFSDQLPSIEGSGFGRIVFPYLAGKFVYPLGSRFLPLTGSPQLNRLLMAVAAVMRTYMQMVQCVDAQHGGKEPPFPLFTLDALKVTCIILTGVVTGEIVRKEVKTRDLPAREQKTGESPIF